MKRTSIFGIILGVTVLAATPARAAAPYTIMKGDNLHRIAAAHGVEIERILYENPSIARPDKIYAGDTIEIPESEATETPAGYEEYTVAKGDCLYQIAAAKGVPVAAIMRLTPGLDNPSLLHVGQTLYIPSAPGQTYTVEKGETLADISDKAGVELDELLQANPGIDPDSIDVGEKIQLPGGAATPSPTETTGQPTASPEATPRPDATSTPGATGLGSQPDATATPATDDNTPEQSPSAGASPEQSATANPEGTPGAELSLTPTAAASPSPSEPAGTPTAAPTRPGTDVAAGEVTDQPIISDISAMEREVFQLLNTERELTGLAALEYDEVIAELARGKSENMAENGYLSHTSPQLGSPFKMLRDNGINYTTASENIARGQRSAMEVVGAWMDSTGHRESMMNPNFTRVGIGFAQDAKGRTYWTMLLIK